MTPKTSKEELLSKKFPVKFDILNTSLVIPDKIIGIYRITSPIGRVYIGQSRNIRHRMRVYRNTSAKGQFRLRNSILKYGIENHTFEILCICSIEELNDLECHYIKINDSFNTEHGLNLKMGGDVELKISDETRKKQSESHIGHIPWNKGIKYSPERVEQMRIISTGRKWTDEQKAKPRKPLPKRTPEQNKNNADARRGQKRTPEQIQEIKDRYIDKPSPLKGRPRSPETIQKIKDFYAAKKLTPEYIEKQELKAIKKERKRLENKIKAEENKKNRTPKKGSLSSFFGKKHSNESKQKQREAKLGRKLTPESIAKREATRKRIREEIEQEKRMMIF